MLQVARVIEGRLIQEAVGVGIAGSAEEEGVIVLEVVLVDLSFIILPPSDGVTTSLLAI